MKCFILGGGGKGVSGGSDRISKRAQTTEVYVLGKTTDAQNETRYKEKRRRIRYTPTHSFSVICLATVLCTRKGSPEPLPDVHEWSSRSCKDSERERGGGWETETEREGQRERGMGIDRGIQREK